MTQVVVRSMQGNPSGSHFLQVQCIMGRFMFVVDTNHSDERSSKVKMSGDQTFPHYKKSGICHEQLESLLMFTS